MRRKTPRASPTADRFHRSARASTPRGKLTGSIELYLGPRAPAGKESNWLATVPGKGYFAILRLYSPLEPALDGSWRPGDLEKLH